MATSLRSCLSVLHDKTISHRNVILRNMVKPGRSQANYTLTLQAAFTLMSTQNSLSGCGSVADVVYMK